MKDRRVLGTVAYCYRHSCRYTSPHENPPCPECTKEKESYNYSNYMFWLGKEGDMI